MGGRPLVFLSRQGIEIKFVKVNLLPAPKPTPLIPRAVGRYAPQEELPKMQAELAINHHWDWWWHTYLWWWFYTNITTKSNDLAIFT